MTYDHDAHRVDDFTAESIDIITQGQTVTRYEFATRFISAMKAAGVNPDTRRVAVIAWHVMARGDQCSAHQMHMTTTAFLAICRHTHGDAWVAERIEQVLCEDCRAKYKGMMN
jgi:hypothetical protein